MKYVALMIGGLMLTLGIRACTYTPVHITTHAISNGNEFACIYESEEDFNQALEDELALNEAYYVREDGSVDYVEVDK